MKWLRAARALFFGCLLPSVVLAATPSTPPPVSNGVLVYYWDGSKLVAVTPSAPLPTTGGGGGGGSVTQGTVPWADNITQFGGSAVALGSAVSSSSIPVVIASNQGTVSTQTVGGSTTAVSGGASSNAASGVATSSTLVPVVASLYGFNGTTWDQLQVDSSKNLKVSLAARSAVTSTTLEANHIITASAGSLYSFEVQADSTLSAAAWWIMVYNATSAPADGAVTPLKCYQMPSGTPGANFSFSNPIAFSSGIVIGVSTTGCFTKTASAHAYISGDF